jgi:hypothetical protein
LSRVVSSAASAVRTCATWAWGERWIATAVAYGDEAARVGLGHRGETVIYVVSVALRSVLFHLVVLAAVCDVADHVSGWKRSVVDARV